ncbi:MAG: hypothetical protein ACRBBP_09305 [Bdellovibrionales bacterium]
MKNVLIFLMLGFLSSCTHALHVYHVSDYTASPKSGKTVKAEGEQRVIMGFVFDTNYVDVAMADLENSCRGKITNINTRYSTSHSFMSWVNKIKLTALCVD